MQSLIVLVLVYGDGLKVQMDNMTLEYISVTLSIISVLRSMYDAGHQELEH